MAEASLPTAPSCDDMQQARAVVVGFVIGVDIRRRACVKQELRRIFDLHLEKFGVWVHELVRKGPWKLAMSVAETERQPGEPVDLQRLSHIFWWDGNLSFIEELHQDDKALVSAFQRVSRVVDHGDTVNLTWRRRERASSRALRVAGERPTESTTLCDAMGDWSVECRGSSRNRCIAHVASKMNCEQFCSLYGHVCEASWDDRDGACEQVQSGVTSCTSVRNSQICACRRDCLDDGPWDCVEENCPARFVNCSMLAGACRHKFRSIWRKPPLRMANVLVQQACPVSCEICSPKLPIADA